MMPVKNENKIADSIVVSCIQVNASEDFEANLKNANALLAHALQRRSHIVSFPENFLWRGRSENLTKIADRFDSSILHFQKVAKNNQIAILLGSLIEPSKYKDKFYNTSVMIDEKGKVVGKYRKIHLFDVMLSKLKVHESRHILPGKNVVTAKIWGIKVGLTICYDLRFPELYRLLSSRECQIIFVPSNFTERTGKVHWQVLLQARAIENLCSIVAPAQTGKNPSTGVRSFGSSMIISPWGKILKYASVDKVEIISSGLNMKLQKSIRDAFPALQHRKLGRVS